MDLPKISIVIPSYNQGQFLEETIRSVIDQEYPNLELIIIDGGSSDNSVDVIKKYEQHLAWWVSEKDKGQSNAINKGLERATGEIISWLCSDDLLMPGSLETIASIFSSAPPDIGLVHGGAIIFESDKVKEIRFTYQLPCKEAYLSGMVFPQPSAFFRKSFLDQAGLLNESLHYGMDYDLFLRLTLVCNFLPIDKVLAKYRLHQQSKSIAESNRFISDWKRSFINLCKNLNWTDELNYLGQTGLFDKEIAYSVPYTFQPDNKIQISIKKKRSVFFHLGHILKDLYWTNQLDQARLLKKRMKSDFDPSLWKEDPRLNTVSFKLSYPSFALNLFKSIKDLVSAR